MAYILLNYAYILHISTENEVKTPFFKEFFIKKFCNSLKIGHNTRFFRI